MYIKAVIGIAVVLLLSSCATTRKGRDLEVQQLKSQVASLETELQTRDQEIYKLEDELEKEREKRLKICEEKTQDQRLSAKQIQMVLKNAGFYKGAINGKIGPATTEAIKAFQRANGLKVDGVLGNKTKAKMMKYLTN